MLKRLPVIVAFIILECFTLKAAVFPPVKEIATTGKYGITSEEYWIEKPQIGAYGNTKEMQIRVWYPVDYDRADHSARVIVFSHGSCGTIDNNVSLYKEMASHGFVVLAVVHPGQAISMIKSDKSTVGVSGDFLKEMSSIKPDTDQEEAYVIYQKWMTERMYELNLVMDDFKLAADRGTYDYERIADADEFIVAGHSLGGSAAYAMARTRNDVIACIALESPCMYDIKGVENGDFVFDDSEYNVPLLNVYTDSSYQYLDEWQQYRNNELFLECKNCVNIYYPGIGHMDICDLSNASPLLAAAFGGVVSKTDAVTNLTLLNKDCMEFLMSLEED